MTDELLKVTLNLYRSDVEALDHIYGYGWSVRVRELVQAHVRSLNGQKPKTVGELFNDNH